MLDRQPEIEIDGATQIFQTLQLTIEREPATLNAEKYIQHMHPYIQTSHTRNTYT